VTDLSFSVAEVSPERFAASPSLLFKLQITESTGATVHAMALRCQLMIEPQRRPYTGGEKAGLADLFGTPDRWADTAKPFLWTHATAMVQGFTAVTEVDLPVLCTYDFDVVAAKYLHALRDGEIPLLLLFSGTVFTRGVNGFGVEQVPWHHEARFRLPVTAWRSLMDAYFPGGGWIRVDRDTLDALVRYKSERALTSWEAAFAELLPPPAAVA